MNQLISLMPPIFLVILIKWSLLFIFVLLLLSIFKKLSPGHRHILWLLLVYGLILIPILSGFMPHNWFENSRSVSQRGEIAKTFNDLFFMQPIYTQAHSVPTVTNALPLQVVGNAFASGYNWPIFMMLIWIAGVFVASFRVIIGRVRVSTLQRGAGISSEEKLRTQVNQLLKKMGIKREVEVLTSSACRIPFTYRLFKPVVVLPGECGAWSSDRVRSVLFHELSHIIRHDCLTQSVARIICSLFWYIPFVWIAYSKLCQEQEKACDASVINRGIRPVDYASHILELARITMRSVSFQGSFLSNGRKKFLERRILYTLSFKREKKVLKGGKTMRPRNLILLCGILLLAIALVGSCATRKKAISEEDFFEAYSGTWINKEYSGSTFSPQKMILYPDGGWEHYFFIEDKKSIAYGKYTMIDMWTDSNGDYWCKTRMEDYAHNTHGFTMVKISDSGNTREMLFRFGDEPIEEWDPDETWTVYMIHYRQ